MAGKAPTLAYKRVLLKISGEMLQGDQDFGFDPLYLDSLAADIKALVDAGAQVGLVVGGGNFCRGQTLQASSVSRVGADQIGMLATMMNGLAIADALRAAGQAVSLFSAIGLPGIIETFDVNLAVAAIKASKVVVLAGGTGSPFFTTDTTASLRAAELGADIVLKATKVDGVYSADPIKNPTATRYERLSYDDVISRSLRVMDLTAICMCKEHNIPIRVFNLKIENVLLRILQGENIGTLVESGDKK